MVNTTRLSSISSSTYLPLATYLLSSFLLLRPACFFLCCIHSYSSPHDVLLTISKTKLQIHELLRYQVTAETIFCTTADDFLARPRVSLVEFQSALSFWQSQRVKSGQERGLLFEVQSDEEHHTATLA